jgi:hypothetical protein
MNLDKLLPILEKLLPVFCVILGWVLNDFLTRPKEDIKHYRVATFHVLRIHKAIMDYERGTRFFRKERPTVDRFEPWRAILEAKCCKSFEINADATSKAVETLASVDPPLAATRRSPDAGTASPMLRPKPLALPVTNHTLDIRILHSPYLIDF